MAANKSCIEIGGQQVKLFSITPDLSSCTEISSSHIHDKKQIAKVIIHHYFIHHCNINQCMQGGFGIIFKASMENPTTKEKRTVAIKELLKDDAKNETLLEFQHEVLMARYVKVTTFVFLIIHCINCYCLVNLFIKTWCNCMELYYHPSVW